MTPAQRKYDTDLVASLQNMAQRVASRSRKLSDALKLAADRISALSSAAPVEPPLASYIQPASPSDQAQPPRQLEPMRD